MGLVINQAFSNGTIRNADNRTTSLNTSCKAAKYLADISCQLEDLILIFKLLTGSVFKVLEKFDLTQDYLLCMGGSVWVDLIELVRHKHARSHKSFFTSPGRPTPLWAPHNHTHSLNKGSLGALNDYTK